MDVSVSFVTTPSRQIRDSPVRMVDLCRFKKLLYVERFEILGYVLVLSPLNYVVNKIFFTLLKKILNIILV